MTTFNVRYYQTIEIKILPCTNHRPTRLKAITTSGKTWTVPVNGGYYSIDDQAYFLAIECLNELLDNRDGKLKINGCGRLNNGNFIFTIDLKD